MIDDYHQWLPPTNTKHPSKLCSNIEREPRGKGKQGRGKKKERFLLYWSRDLSRTWGGVISEVPPPTGDHHIIGNQLCWAVKRGTSEKTIFLLFLFSHFVFPSTSSSPLHWILICWAHWVTLSLTCSDFSVSAAKSDESGRILSFLSFPSLFQTLSLGRTDWLQTQLNWVHLSAALHWLHYYIKHWLVRHFAAALFTHHRTAHRDWEYKADFGLNFCMVAQLSVSLRQRVECSRHVQPILKLQDLRHFQNLSNCIWFNCSWKYCSTFPQSKCNFFQFLNLSFLKLQNWR